MKFRFVDRDMFVRYLGGGVGHMDAGARVETTFDDEDIDWQDLDPEMAEIMADEPDESGFTGTLGASPDMTSDLAVSSEADVARLVEGLSTASESGTCNSEPEAETDEGDPDEENGDDDDEDEDEDKGEGDDEDDGEKQFEEDEDGEEDEYGCEGYAPP